MHPVATLTSTTQARGVWVLCVLPNGSDGRARLGAPVPARPCIAGPPLRLNSWVVPVDLLLSPHKSRCVMAPLSVDLVKWDIRTEPVTGIDPSRLGINDCQEADQCSGVIGIWKEPGRLDPLATAGTRYCAFMDPPRA